MVASVPYVKASEPHLLETYTPEVTNAYVSARLEAVPVIIRFDKKFTNRSQNYFYCSTYMYSQCTSIMQVLDLWLSILYVSVFQFFSLQHLRDGLEDPLDDMGMVIQQLEQVSVIARCDYQKTCTMLVQVFDQTAALYQDLISSSNTVQVDLNIQESKWSVRLFLAYLVDHLQLCKFVRVFAVRLTWLVYIIGAAIGGRVSVNTNEEYDVMDGEMVVRYVDDGKPFQFRLFVF